MFLTNDKKLKKKHLQFENKDTTSILVLPFYLTSSDNFMKGYILNINN